MFAPIAYESDIIKVKDKNDWVKSHEEIIEEIHDKKYVEILATHLT
jgi:hypothetical protein